jgi:hypothetical protein
MATKKEKRLDEMTNEELSKSWQTRIEKYLLGKSIIKIEYMSEKDADEQGWSKRPIQILLNNGTWLTITSDDEGNDGGAIHTNIEKLPIIPVIY